MYLVMTDVFGETFACGLDARQIRNQPRAVLRKRTCEYRHKLVLSAPSTDHLSCTTTVRVGFRG
jgi:hypothetical protein